MATPGHTPACISYRIGDALFHGDTLFMPDYGTARCDFPGGDAATLYRSIRRILSLPPETRLFNCHDYGPNGRAFAWETTVAAQRRDNIHIKDGIDEAAFVAMRARARQDLGGAGADSPRPSSQYPRRPPAGTGIERHRLSEDPPQSDLTPIPGRSGERSAGERPVLRNRGGRSPVVTRPLSAAPAAGEVWMP